MHAAYIIQQMFVNAFFYCYLYHVDYLYSYSYMSECFLDAHMSHHPCAFSGDFCFVVIVSAVSLYKAHAFLSLYLSLCPLPSKTFLLPTSLYLHPHPIRYNAVSNERYMRCSQCTTQFVCYYYKSHTLRYNID